MIFCLTLNPSIDTEIFVPVLSGRDVQADQVSYRIAGKAINVAETLMSSNTECHSMVFAGVSDSRATFTKAHELFPHTDPMRQNFSIFEHQELRAHIRSPFETTFQRLMPLFESLVDRCRSEDIIVLAGTIPTLADDLDYTKIIGFFRALNGQIVLDTPSFDLPMLLHLAPHTLKINASEFRHTFGIADDAALTNEQVLAAARLINARVIVTQGKGTIIAADAYGDTFSCHILQIGISGRASIIGSGDSFLGGYTAALNSRDGFRECVVNGVAFGVARQASNTLSDIIFDEASISKIRSYVDIVEVISSLTP
jgi:fructose-1-phosphate kinase PfkB-like protein